VSSMMVSRLRSAIDICRDERSGDTLPRAGEYMGSTSARVVCDELKWPELRTGWSSKLRYGIGSGKDCIACCCGDRYGECAGEYSGE
jgi:hypothetical protein